MSLTVLLIGAAHGVPVVLASVISKRKWVAIAVALGMLYVAVNWGGQAYLGADVLGIIAGTIFAWFVSKPPESAEISANPEIGKAIQKAGEEQRRRYERNQWLDKAAKEFGSKLLVKWAREALWKEDSDSHGVERKRAICEKLVRCSFDRSRQHELLDEDFLHQVMAEVKDYHSWKRMCARAVLDCLDLGIFPPKIAKKVREDFERAYTREADEEWRRVVELANQVLDREKRSAAK